MSEGQSDAQRSERCRRWMGLAVAAVVALGIGAGRRGAVPRHGRTGPARRAYRGVRQLLALHSVGRRSSRTGCPPTAHQPARSTARWSNVIVDHATRPATGWWPSTGASSPTARPGSSARPGTSCSTSPSSGWPRPPTTAATGWWPPTGACSASVTPPSTARPATSCSTSPSSAWPRRPTAHGYWLVARDGGVFSLRRRRLLRLDRQPRAAPADRRHQPRPPTGTATGWWPRTAGCSPSATPASTAPRPGRRRSRSSRSCPRRAAPATGSSSRTAPPRRSAAPSGKTLPPQALLFEPITPGDKAVLFAFQQLGKPYIWGGNGPVGYDCSGLALASWVHGAGISFARVADDQYHTAGTQITFDQLAGRRPRVLGHRPERLDHRVPHGHLRGRGQDRRVDRGPRPAQHPRPVEHGPGHALRPSPLRAGSGGSPDRPRPAAQTVESRLSAPHPEMVTGRR